MSHSPISPPIWRKSSRSSDLEKAVCVEVAAIDRARAIRDSKDPDGPQISMSVAALRGFVGAIKNDAFGG